MAILVLEFNIYKMRIHYITYLSNGGDVDKGMDLSHLKKPLSDIYSRYLDRVTIYDSFDVPEQYRKEYNQAEFESKVNPGYHNLEFAAFKPYLILKTLMETDCDVVYWRDGNILKYHNYLNNLPDVRRTIEYSLETVGTDIFVPIESWKAAQERAMGMSCTSLMFEKILGRIKSEYIKYPEINNSLIILKNTDYSKELVKKWLEYMQIDDFFNNEIESYHRNYIANSSDQSILNVLILKEIMEGRLPQGFPFLYYVDRNFSIEGLYKIENLPYIQ